LVIDLLINEDKIRSVFVHVFYFPENRSVLNSLNDEEKQFCLDNEYIYKAGENKYKCTPKGLEYRSRQKHFDEAERISRQNLETVFIECYKNNCDFHDLRKIQRIDLKKYGLVRSWAVGYPKLTEYGAKLVGLTVNETDKIYVDLVADFWKRNPRPVRG